MSAWAPADSATGLWRADLDGLDEADKRLLAIWHREHSGSDDGRPWLPAAIRTMPPALRMELASSAKLAAAWRKTQRAYVERDVTYFVMNYGSIQPEEGPPIPFALWPEQVDVLAAFVEHLRVIVLKARQLGLTWLALHFAAHLMAFDAATPNARVLALSKVGEDAKKLLARARKLTARLPPFLRPAEDRSTRDSSTNFKLAGRGEMVSLMGTPEAARMETATLALIDEMGHIRNRQAQATLTAVLPTVGRRGRIIAIFTGNGPAEAPGDGQAAARLYTQAAEGAEDEQGSRWHHIFLPDTVDPQRTPEVRAGERREFLSDEEYAQEHPLTPDEALAGKHGLKVFSPAGISAAVALGAEFDELLAAGELAPPLNGFVRTCADFGELMALLPLWPLEGGGLYVPPGEVVPAPGQAQEVGAACAQLHAHIREWQRNGSESDRLDPLIGRLYYDASGPQSARTFTATVEGISPREPGRQDERASFLDQWDYVLRPYRGQQLKRVWPLRKGVPFGKYKHDTVSYLRHLFQRTAEGEASRIIAISPTNRTLIRQLRGLEMKDDGTGRVEKGDDDAPDALIAGATPTALAFRGELLASESAEESEGEAGAAAA